jgi:hypothetical protein
MSEILSAAKFETMAIDVAYGGPAAPLCASHEALRAERDAAARITRESRRRETEQRARAGNAEKSVRVLTEALALLLAGVETGHFNTAIDDARSVLAAVPSGALWSCSHCGPHPDSTANWCAAGCGSDYNRMTSMPKEES